MWWILQIKNLFIFPKTSSFIELSHVPLSASVSTVIYFLCPGSQTITFVVIVVWPLCLFVLSWPRFFSLAILCTKKFFQCFSKKFIFSHQISFSFAATFHLFSRLCFSLYSCSCSAAAAIAYCLNMVWLSQSYVVWFLKPWLHFSTACRLLSATMKLSTFLLCL